MNWYKAKNSNDTQGLVIDEKTGANIAVTYDPKHAELIAAAPELADALGAISDLADMVDATRTEKKIARIARAALKKAGR